ncbi:MAG: peptide chain release factor-like protein [Phycisphaerales bacterium]
MSWAAGARGKERQRGFAATRSTGPGGQNVNKRSTAWSCGSRWMRSRCRGLPRLARMAGSRLTAEGELILASEEHRSQKRNKDECLERLRELLVRAMVKPKPRKKTKPSKGSKERPAQGEAGSKSERKARRQTSCWSRTTMIDYTFIPSHTSR